MPGKELGQQLKELISSLQEQGILDDQFNALRGLQDENNPCFVVETITSFLANSENDIAQVKTYLSEPQVNFQELSKLAYKLRGSSSSVGGCLMAFNCRELQDACEANDQEACLIVHDFLNRDFLVLKENLNHIAQMERTIYENELKRRNN